METPALVSSPTHPYFRPTTVSQRQHLFRLVEDLGNVSEAARQAHVGRGTYYTWRERYEAEGLAGLAAERSRAPQQTRIPPVSPEIQAEVLAYDQAHPGLGCRTVASRIRLAHHWAPVISHSKVWEIRRAAAAPRENPAPAGPAPVAPAYTPVAAVHAPQPDQTYNLDLCVVPWTHAAAQDLPAVSVYAAAAGATPPDPAAPPAASTWPGQAFADSELSYPAQMQDYVAQRTAKRAAQGQRKQRRRHKQAERAELNAHQDELRLQRRRVRLTRQAEATAWREVRQAHRAAEQTWQGLSKAERKTRKAARLAEQARWRALKATRRDQQTQRESEDATWRQARQELREQRALLDATVALVTVWVAILVVIDNCTRRCVQVPLFTVGAHVTAALVVAALRAACPPELQFLITDNGAQFIAKAFAEFVQEMEFVHVRIAPYHACTNGIAERFVRTLKEWLETHTWNSPEDLEALLAEFLLYYNDRPHQGAELKGLSPNEYARRLANCSGC
jgi:transposase InsO family protein/transposase